MGHEIPYPTRDEQEPNERLKEYLDACVSTPGAGEANRLQAEEPDPQIVDTGWPMDGLPGPLYPYTVESDSPDSGN